MNPEIFQLTLFAAALATTPILCAIPRAQGKTDAEAQKLLDRIESVRGQSASPAALSIEGRYTVNFTGAATPEPVAAGTFRELYAGADRARQTMSMGEAGAMERGLAEGNVVWEVDPAMGAKVYTAAQGLPVRRHFGFMRGAPPKELYRQAAVTGKQKLGEREHLVLRLTPAEGQADTWYVDAETGLVSRIDIVLPAPEGDEIPAELGFADWQKVAGVMHPHRRTLKMGPAIVTFVCEKFDAGASFEATAFAPPEAVAKAKTRPSAREAGDGKPEYQVIDCAAQPVASIRVKCKPAEISATLAVLLPEVMSHLNTTGAKLAGAPFSRYHGEAGGELDLEAGIPVAKPITEKGRIKNSELPAGKTVTTWHVGPYEKLGAAHQALQKWLASNQHTARGGVWEVYWTDPGLVPDPAKWRTQLFAPIGR